jgi:cytochrome bd-type quinol oxidase subunit 2
MDVLVFLANNGACGGLEQIVRVIKSLFNIIQILVPIALLIMGVIDLAKAVLASDDKEIKAATSKLVKRAIAAVAVFFAVTLVNVIMGLVASGQDAGEETATNWATCWNNV